MSSPPAQLPDEPDIRPFVEVQVPDLDEVSDVPAPPSGIEPPLARTPAHHPDRVRAVLAKWLALAAIGAVALVILGWLIGGRDVAEILPTVSLLTTLAASAIAFYFGSQRQSP